MEIPLETWKVSLVEEMAKDENDVKIRRKYHRGRGKKERKIWVVQHENLQPVIFSNPTTALEYGREQIAKRTHNYDGSSYIDRDAVLCIIGYYINDKDSPAFVLTSNLFNEELIVRNNSIYDLRSEEESEIKVR